MAQNIDILILDGQNRLVKEAALKPGQEWIVGSSSEGDLVLGDQEGVYPEHCLISAAGDGLIVKNLSVLGKVYLNGIQVEYRPLHKGDVIEIGPYKIKICSDKAQDLAHLKGRPIQATPPSSSAADFSIPTPDMGTAPPPEEAVSVASTGGEDKTIVADIMKGQLQWLSPGGVRSFDLLGETTIVGRGEHVNIKIEDGDLSREHFSITQKSGSFYLADLNSVNGTRVNGVRVAEAILRDGDEIEAGSSHFKVLIGLREALTPAVEPEEKTQRVEFFVPQKKKKEIKKVPFYRVRRNQMLILGGLGLLLGLVFLLEPTPETPKPVATAPSPTPVAPKDPWELLTKAQQEEIEKNYAEAQKLIARKDWENAFVLLRKIQDMGVPYKDVEQLIKQVQDEIVASEQKLYEEEQRSAEKERQDLIVQYLKEGKIYLEQKNFDQAREMFQNVLELDPLNEEAIRGMEAAASKQEDIDFKEKERKLREENERKVAEYYQQSMQLVDANEFDNARELVKKRLKVVEYTTDHWNYEFDELLKLVNQREHDYYAPQVEEGKRLLAAQEWKSAWEVCNMVYEKNPELDEALACRQKADDQLQLRSRKLYQDAIVAESLGNLGEAKDKWKQILDISPPYDIYFKRAQDKLVLYK